MHDARKKPRYVLFGPRRMLLLVKARSPLLGQGPRIPNHIRQHSVEKVCSRRSELTTKLFFKVMCGTKLHVPMLLTPEKVGPTLTERSRNVSKNLVARK